MPSPTPEKNEEIIEQENHLLPVENVTSSSSPRTSDTVSHISSTEELPMDLPLKPVKKPRFSFAFGTLQLPAGPAGYAGLPNDSSPTATVIPSPSKLFNKIFSIEPQLDENGNITKGRRHTVALGTSAVEAVELRMKKKRLREMRRKRLEEDIITINCSGDTWQIKRKLLLRFPETLLGSPALENYWRSDLKCYFFDRNRNFFENVMQFYACGKLNALKEMDPQVVKFELQFFKLLRPKEKTSRNSLSASLSTLSENSSCELNLELTWREKLFRFLNNPKLNVWSMVYTVTDVIMVCTAVGIMIFETDEGTMPDAHVKGSYWFKIVHMADVFFMFFFSFDFVLRIISWPSMRTYLRSGMNVVDIVALAPYYIQHGVDIIGVKESMELIVMFRVARLLRIVRVFRFIRHSEELFQICYFVFNVRSQLGVLYFFSHMIILVFGALMYYVEGGPDFSSILDSCWWAVVTLSTLGYGDKVPKGMPGCIVGSIAVMIGMVILSLPMTIVVSRFAEWYEDEKGAQSQPDVDSRRS